MKNSNKVLLAAVATLLAFFLTFVLVMGFSSRELLRRRGTTAYAVPAAVEARAPAAGSGAPSAPPLAT